MRKGVFFQTTFIFYLKGSNASLVVIATLQPTPANVGATNNQNPVLLSATDVLIHPIKIRTNCISNFLKIFEFAIFLFEYFKLFFRESWK